MQYSRTLCRKIYIGMQVYSKFTNHDLLAVVQPPLKNEGSASRKHSRSAPALTFLNCNNQFLLQSTLTRFHKSPVQGRLTECISVLCMQPRAVMRITVLYLAQSWFIQNSAHLSWKLHSDYYNILQLLQQPRIVGERVELSA